MRLDISGKFGISMNTAYLDKLNDNQRKAVVYGVAAESLPPPLLVIAGAGTGKTNTLAHRVAHLLVNGADPRRILLMTFSRRAATELARRVERITSQAMGTGYAAEALTWAGTFHGIGARILREHGLAIGLNPDFSIHDREDSADLMNLCRHGLGLSNTESRFPAKGTCLSIYSRAVNAEEKLSEVLPRNFPWCAAWEADLKRLFGAYVSAKQEQNVLDYDDLLLAWAQTMEDPAFALHIGANWDHVLIDEYQDTNHLQARILLSLKPDGRGLTVVGDDAQSIYAFRAATVRNILDFPAAFSPPANVVTLDRNYRSTKPILDAANAVIGQAQERFTKDLWTERPSAEKPRLVTLANEADQARYIVDRVLADREVGLRLMDQAVLFRGAHHSDRLELELVRRNIPYVKYGGLKFLEAGHVKDVLSVLKWAENPKNEIAAFRVLKLLPGMGPATASRCFQHLTFAEFAFSALRHFRPPAATANGWVKFCELMESLSAVDLDDEGWQTQLTQVRRWYQPHLERLYDGLDTREADLEQLEQISGRYPTRERFLTELTLDPPSAVGDLAGDPLLDEDYLVLSTVHSAKGQEWDAVYVLNVSDGNFPSEFATGKPLMIEEERRLLYVAMTRAKQSLALIAPLKYHVTQQRRDGDKHVYGARSRFMTDALLGTMQRRFHGHDEAQSTRLQPRTDKRLDVAARVREMW